jgi:hypothetical protein
MDHDGTDDRVAPTWLDTFERMSIALSTEFAVAASIGQPPNPAGAASVLIEDMVARRRERGAQFVESVLDGVSPEQLAQAVQPDDERETLIWNGMQAAMATAMRAKRIYLARVAADALNNDDLLDDALMITAALQELDGVHIRALKRLVMADAETAVDPGSNDDPRRDALLREHPGVLTALIRAGVVYQGSVIVSEGLMTMPHAETYSITGVNDFGHRLLAHLAEYETLD